MRILGAIAAGGLLWAGHPATERNADAGKAERAAASDTARAAEHAGEGHGRPDSVVGPKGRRTRGRAAIPRILCGPLPVPSLRWDPRQGALRLGGRLVVGPDQELELPAGTLVVADQDNSCLDSTGAPSRPSILVAGGTLRISGTWRDPVVLRPLREGDDLPWDGVQAAGTRDDQLRLRWFEVRRARVGVNVWGGSGSIDHGTAVDCGIGFGAAGGAAPRIAHSVVARSRVADLASEKSAPILRSCLFLDGRGDGARFSGSGLARVEHSLFWNHGGTEIVRGPAGLGRWRSDTAPDAFGNWRRDPILRGTASEAEFSARLARENAGKPWWKWRRFPHQPPGRGPWVPSPYSPMLGAGEWRIGGRADIGLWDELR